MQGTCQCCRLNRKLVRGHSIPNAFIRRARKKGALKYIPLGRTQKISNASSTGADYIFCESCDSKLGNRFDKPAFSWVTQEKFCDTEIEDTVIAQFLSSVFWRASLSNHHYTRGFLGPTHELTPFLEKATFDSKATFKIASYDVRRIKDDVFSINDLEGLIIFPVLRVADTNMGQSFVFLRTVFGGCSWSMALPSLQPQPASSLKSGGRRDIIETVDLKRDPELASFVVGALDKRKRGEISHKIR